MARSSLLATAMIAAMLPLSAHAATDRKPFGTTPDGTKVEAVTLTNDHGLSVTVISLGAAVQKMIVPDRKGRGDDVVLGYDTLEGYLTKSAFFGATVGRVANRIAGGKFTLAGHSYQVPLNNGENALHGGTKGFDKVVWKIVSVQDGKTPSVTLRYVSPNGDMGFPGTLTTTATYSLDEQNQMHIDYRATTDAPTIVNISNHSYWNLAGAGAPEGALNEFLTIPADSFTPTDKKGIPSGEFRAVDGTPFDFRTPTRIAARVRDGKDEQLRFGRGYDHNWVISRTPPHGMQLMARVVDPHSGRVMEIRSNQPGLQFYSGNFLDSTITGKGGIMYREGDAIVLESQAFPDTPNHPDFGSVRLNPGQTYENHILYTFTTLPRKHAKRNRRR